MAVAGVGGLVTVGMGVGCKRAVAVVGVEEVIFWFRVKREEMA